jgi:hypothetical protein
MLMDVSVSVAATEHSALYRIATVHCAAQSNVSVSLPEFGSRMKK